MVRSIRVIAISPPRSTACVGLPYAGLDGACPPPPGVAKDKSVPDPRLYRAGPTTRSVALD